jgi:hypothetical protein
MTEPEIPKTGGLRSLMSGAKTWWVMPLVVGLVLTGVVLLLTDFYPDLKRFYSVF